MPYYRIALNLPLEPLTYFSPDELALGTRVAVPLRRKQALGVVWAADPEPALPAEKILPVSRVFADEPPLPSDWRELVEFAARYYHYPLGQTLFTALPHSLKETQAHPVPSPPLHYTLTAAGTAQAAPPARFRNKHALWTKLAAGGGTLAELKPLDPQAAARLQQWQQQGWLHAAPLPLPLPAPSPHPLNTDQQAAADAICQSFGQFQTFLLHGITGSGKTEVYFEAAAQVLAQGKQVLFLLPEINLTPQLLQRMRQRFDGIPTAVLHSRTAAARRGSDYLRALLGQAKLLVGTRLAVFTPIADLGLIVVDEEHDGSFKQENELRYHARDLAVWRGRQADCPVVLGSATPSLESWHHAQSGRYRLLTLPQRARQTAALPEIKLTDIRKIPLDNGFAPSVLQALQDNFRQGGLSLVYLNRRGFAPVLFCGDCGHSFVCPHCSAKTVLHQRARQLRCHHCGFRQPVPLACPDCGNQDLTAVGQGTQRVEETLRRLLPQARILRVDRDSAGDSDDWQQTVAADGADILVGTQMLAKGHDFARLNLVTVLDADGSLYSSDFRAPERLFAELVQVAGRAGRADGVGRVMIQTRLPEHEVFAAVKTQDYPAFARQQLAERQDFGMPPFAFQAAVRADAPTWAEAAAFLDGIKDALAPHLPDTVAQMGAVPMLMARLAGRERAQVFLEGASRRDVHRAVSLWTAALQQQTGGALRWSVDIDPQEM